MTETATPDVTPGSVNDETIRLERLEQVADWIRDHCRPVAHVISPDADAQEPSQEFEIREYQVNAWDALWEARKKGVTRALIALATGLGKTNVAIFDEIKFGEELAAQVPGKRPRILWLSHLNDLKDQAQERTEAFMPDASLESFKTGRVQLPGADVTFGTYQSVGNELERFERDAFDYIVHDEAHHSEADTFSRVRDYFRPLFELALTATPDRTDDRDIRDYFGEALYSVNLPEALAKGWLVDVDYHIVLDEALRKLIEEGFRPESMADFRRLFNVPMRNEAIARDIVAERHKIGLDKAKTILFCNDIEHANEMARLLGGAAYHSGLDKDELAVTLGAFRNGDQQVICTVDMFNEGMDVPDARLLVKLRSTASPIIFDQQLGRGLRKHPGKDKVTVLDFVGNIERIMMIRKLSERIAEERKKHARERAIGEDGEDTTEYDANGLHITSPHSTFTFEKLAVDVLDFYTELRQDALPGEALTIQASATKLGVAVRTLRRWIGELRMDLPKYMVGSHVNVPGMHEEHLDVIRRHPQYQDILRGVGLTSLTKSAAQLHVTEETLASIMEEMAVEPYRYRRQGRPCRGLDNDQLELLRTHPKTGDDDTGELTAFTQAATELGISQTKLTNVVKAKGWELTDFKKIQVAKGFTADQMAELHAMGLARKEFDEENEVSVGDVLEQLGISRPILRRGCEELGITVGDRKRNGKGVKAITKAELRRLLTETNIYVEPAPQGWKSIASLANELGVAEGRVSDAVNDQGWDLKEVKFGSRRTGGLDPGMISIITDIITTLK